MSKITHRSRPVMAFLAMISIALLPSAAGAASTAPQRSEAINVTVNFSTQVPQSDEGDEAIAAAQTAGRKLIYRMVGDECRILMEIMAKTCRITKLNVNAQVRPQRNQSQPMLHINGNASFLITLKDNEDKEE